MQCSGIHRSLGVHISKVRSATLDTWLPEQVAFIQSMGNEKANSFWEAELPPNYDRVGIENFIRAKYEEKRWTPKDGKSQSPSRVHDEKPSAHWQRSGERSGHRLSSSSENLFEERNHIQAVTTKNSLPATRISIPVPPKGPEQVTPLPQPQQVVQKAESQEMPAETTKQAADVASAVSPPKVDFATDLFNMLSVDSPSENGSEASSNDDAWAGFQSAGEASSTEKAGSAKSTETITLAATGIEDLFKDSPSLANSQAPQKPQKDVKNDIMSLFEKSNIVSPFFVHQQQLAMLAQHQSLLMAAAAKSGGGDPKFSASNPQQASNGANFPTPNWPNVGLQVPGMMMPMGGPADLQKLMQNMNMGLTHQAGNSVPYPAPSFYTMEQVTPVNGVATPTTNKPQSASPVSSSSQSTPSQSGKDYDFSSLTKGLFSK